MSAATRARCCICDLGDGALNWRRLGIAVLGSVGVAVYRTGLDGTLPKALTPAQQHAVTRTLADATHTSAELTQRASGERFHAAAAAFTDSRQLVAASAAVIPPPGPLRWSGTTADRASR